MNIQFFKICILFIKNSCFFSFIKAFFTHSPIQYWNIVSILYCLIAGITKIAKTICLSQFNNFFSRNLINNISLLNFHFPYTHNLFSLSFFSEVTSYFFHSFSSKFFIYPFIIDFKHNEMAVIRTFSLFIAQMKAYFFFFVHIDQNI